MNKGLLALRDFLGAGRSDPFANDSCTSVACEIIKERDAEKGGVQWGCICKGNVAKGGAELTCARCKLTFHEKCERLDYSPSEIAKMQQLGTFVCADCEQKLRVEEGYDPSLGRFVWQCRTCTRSYDESEQRAAEMHGKRCAAELSRRKYSCACNGKQTSTKLLATQCKQCDHWFHMACKTQLRNSWDANGTGKVSRDLCGACEKANAASKGNGKAAATAATAATGGPSSEGGGASSSAVSRADKTAALGDDQFAHGALTAEARADEVPGTLLDGRVFVKASTLGELAGLGLFAGVAFKRNDVITGYYGTPVYKGQLAKDTDTSYVVRLPSSGGVLLDGKAFSDALRANTANPDPEGKWFPVEGAIEWRLGAGSLGNDPRDRRKTNCMLAFKKARKGGNKAFNELAPALPLLLATRDIEAGEELLYSYGSDKPFEDIRKALLAQQEAAKRGLKDVVKLIWQPYE